MTSPAVVVFLDEPLLQRAPRGRMRLVTPLPVLVYGALYVLAVGFDSDGSSVPPWAWALVGHPYSPSSLRAALLHDWLCRHRHVHGLSMQRVHWVFYCAMRGEGVAWPRAVLKYSAVAVVMPRWNTPSPRAEVTV